MKMKMFVGQTEEEAMDDGPGRDGPGRRDPLHARAEDGRVEIRAAIERNFGQKFAAPKFAEAAADVRRDALAALLFPALAWRSGWLRAHGCGSRRPPWRGPGSRSTSLSASASKAC